MATFKFHRGEYLRDRVTQFCGVVVARSDYLTSCNAYLLQPALDKDGKPRDGVWFDEPRLEIDPERLGQKLRLDRVADEPPG